tara:strand:- start:85 stop:357 length:273 start_codon:yes stop_codon:yes gene_type:complete
MIYREFLKKYGIHLDHESPRNFSAYALSNGWQAWNDSPHRDFGLCCDKITGQFYLFDITIEIIGKLQFRIYHVRDEMFLTPGGEYEKTKG